MVTGLVSIFCSFQLRVKLEVVTFAAKYCRPFRRLEQTDFGLLKNQDFEGRMAPPNCGGIRRTTLVAENLRFRKYHDVMITSRKLTLSPEN